MESVLRTLPCRLGLVEPDEGSEPDMDMMEATVEVMREDREEGSGELRVGSGEWRGEDSRLVTLLLRLPDSEECFCRTEIIASRSASWAAWLFTL